LSYPGDRAETTLHLRVAIRAQEDALAYLRTQTLNAMGAALRDPELLGMRIQMMELKCRHAPFITAQPATSAGLLNQKVLYLAATSYNRLHPASTTSEVPARSTHVRYLSVARTSQNRFRKTRRSCLARALSTWAAASVSGAQLVPVESVSYRPLAAPNRLGNLRD